MGSPLVLICPLEPGQALPPRLQQVLDFALAGLPGPAPVWVTQAAALAPPPGARLLFVVALDAGGINLEYAALLRRLRQQPELLAGCLGALLVDSPTELGSKATARELVLAANGAGCAFIGQPLVEATGSLQNFAVQAKVHYTSLFGAYRAAAARLVQRLLQGQPPRPGPRPSILVIHASTYRYSNTLDLWGALAPRLPEADIRELCLRNGTLADCVGCAYHTCLHYGERGSCFYGGVMVSEVYPALEQADALVMLCPNYNDAISANLCAFINRLTAMFRAKSFAQKQLFALVVSGYSGGDLVAAQLVSALSLNKGFYLPPHFALLETANDPGAALHLPGIQDRLGAQADRMRTALGLQLRP